MRTVPFSPDLLASYQDRDQKLPLAFVGPDPVITGTESIPVQNLL